MDKLNPDALAEWSDEEGAPAGEVRPGVQPNVTPEMIADYVVDAGELPRESAEPFGEYLHRTWNDYVEGADITHRDLVAGALAYWRGQ
ncbi:hypothetical protein [Streptomyces sp. OK228]|uniref:hypothetical protein n=1 Tax=Streptomyces sp. OK228 TaxID=1882786 RepID=UPI000BDC3815|nr:hypothetical protein [Streptomyces sp. OK228]SOE25700.1 hypothetical protein SAMN05442782_2445 [Streptomyces sp. OK228]